MKGITFMVPRSLFDSLCTSCQRRYEPNQRRKRYILELKRKPEAPRAVRMWFGLLGAQYSPYASRHQRLEPGYTYIVRDRDGSGRPRLIRTRPSSNLREQYVAEREYDSPQRRRLEDSWEDDEEYYAPPPTRFPDHSYDRHYRDCYCHCMSQTQTPRPQNDRQPWSYHDFNHQARHLRAQLDDPHHRPQSPIPPTSQPSPIRKCINSPSSSSSSSSSTSSKASKDSKGSEKKSSTSEKPKHSVIPSPGPPSSPDHRRRVRFANVEDYLEGMYDGPLPPAAMGYGYSGHFEQDPRHSCLADHNTIYGGGDADMGSRWDTRPCYDEGLGGYGIVREPKGSFRDSPRVSPCRGRRYGIIEV